MKVYEKIEIPFSLAMPGGLLYNFVYEWILKEYNRKYKNGILYLHGVTPDIQPSFADLVAIVVNGGKFTGIKLGIQIAMSAKDTPVPEGIPGRDGNDVDGNPIVRTWLEWIQAGNIDYRIKDDNSDAIFKGSWHGQTLDSDALNIIHALPYASVIEWQALVDLVNSAEYQI